MRYYDIALTAAPTTGSPAVRQWTSFPNGQSDPGALNVEFDFFSFFQTDNDGASTLTIHGVPLGDLQNAAQFNGMYVTMKAGMQAGLPLANPGQQGVVLQGQIFQAFGNWVGTEMTLDFVINYSNITYLYRQPGNLVLNWPKNTSLKNALAACLNVAYPTIPVRPLIADDYILGHDTLHSCNTLNQLSGFVNSITSHIRPPGVRIALQNNSILAYDGTQATGKTIDIAFVDMVGQPVWMPISQNTPPTIQLTTVMRGDVQVGNIIHLPKGLASTPGQVTTPPSPALLQLLKYQSIIKGPFLVTGIRYIGNFRDPNGTSWVTVFRCVPQSVN